MYTTPPIRQPTNLQRRIVLELSMCLHMRFGSEFEYGEGAHDERFRAGGAERKLGQEDKRRWRGGGGENRGRDEMSCFPSLPIPPAPSPFAVVCTLTPVSRPLHDLSLDLRGCRYFRTPAVLSNLGLLLLILRLFPCCGTYMYTKDDS